MNAIFWLFIGMGAAMVLGFLLQYIKALIIKICYYVEKRKAFKNNDPDAWWIYKD